MHRNESSIVVIGASAGGIQALLEVIAELPATYASSIFIVVHVGTARSLLPTILSRGSQLAASHASDGEQFVAGHIYVAPPDFHMLVREDRIELSHGPRENHSRPAVDPLFRSAARAHGSRVTGIVLSGALSDGTTGLLSVKSHGGTVIVQDPEDAIVEGMPVSALRLVDADQVLPAREIGRFLASADVSASPLQEAGHIDDPFEAPAKKIRADFLGQERDSRGDQLTMYTCPDCGGTLWQSDTGKHLGFQCHVGHTWGIESLLGQKSEELEAALWSCVRMLEERATLSRQVAVRLRDAGDQPIRTERVEDQAQLDEQRADAVRSLLDGSVAVAPREVSQRTESTPVA